MNRVFCDGNVILITDFLTLEERVAYFECLKTEIQWKHEPIMMFGKLVMQPRLTAWYGDPASRYRYSGITQEPLPWTESLLKLRSKIENQVDAKFNAVLLNQYRDENDSMGWHRDNEKELGVDPIIASISLGETRRFLLRRHRDDAPRKPSERQEMDLNSGSLLIMKGKSQTHWEHSLPKTSKARSVRINLTYRLIRIS